jgi:AhpD family alkylhydroperoxidase
MNIAAVQRWSPFQDSATGTLFRAERSGDMHVSEDPMYMPKNIFPQSTPQLGEIRKGLAPDVHEAFASFSERVFAEGALPAKTKQLIAVAAAHITHCPYCIRGHTRAALRDGASAEEIMEAIWVAAEMRAGGAYAHSALALDTIAEVKGRVGA